MMHCGYSDTTWKDNHSAILTPTVVGGWRPLPSEICAQSDPPPSKRADFDIFPLISYNISTLKNSEKSTIMMNRKSTMGFPMSHSWSAYVTPKPQRVTQKTDVFRFLNKTKLQSNKVCYKVPLCENFQRQSCRMTIPYRPYLTVHRYWRETLQPKI